jgi:hypothetical protein
MSAPPNLATPGVPSILGVAAQQIQNELNRRPTSPMVLSAQATAKLGIVHTEFFGDIGTEAVRIARRAGLATVDEIHVDEAVSRACQESRTSVVSGAANTLGSIIAGVALAGWYAILFNQPPHSGAEYVVAAISTTLAGILLTMAFLLVRRG